MKSEIRFSLYKKVYCLYRIVKLSLLYQIEILYFFQNEAGRIQLEGTVCEDYFRIRTLLYQQYAIV